MSDLKAVLPANPKPCKDCPWRLSNQGKRMKHGFYAKKNLRRLWAGLRRGVRMTCHPTDLRMAEWEGYEQTADREKAHECTGALILQQRECMKWEAISKEAEAAGTKGGMKIYQRRHPLGMTRTGLAEIVTRAVYGGTPFDPLKMTRPELDQDDVGYPPLGEWKAPR